MNMIVRKFTKIPLAIGEKQVNSGVIDVFSQPFSDMDELVDAVVSEHRDDFIGGVRLTPSAIGLVNALALKGVDGLGM